MCNVASVSIYSTNIMSNYNVVKDIEMRRLSLVLKGPGTSKQECFVKSSVIELLL